jgi:hypothetical protein
VTLVDSVCITGLLTLPKGTHSTASSPSSPSPSPLPPLPSSSLRAVARLQYSLKRQPELRGHFPDMPILPAVYSVEAMYQTAAALAFSSTLPNPTDTSTVTIDETFLHWMYSLQYPFLHNARFFSPITPHRMCDICVTLKSFRDELREGESRGDRVWMEGSICDVSNGEVAARIDFDFFHPLSRTSL